MSENNINKINVEEAFLEYNEIIYKYIFIRTFYKREVAEDLTQEVFIKAWNNREKFDSNKASLKTWLFVIARNTIIDHIRKNKKNVFVNLEDEEDFIDEQTEDVEKKDEYKKIIEKMDLLKPKEKDLLILRFIEELEIEEISKIIKKNYTATKVAIHRAINKLKKLVYGK